MEYKGGGNIMVGKTYRHYKKGDRYIVLEIAKYSETQEDMIVYRAEYGNKEIWVRPASMWSDVIPYDKRTWFNQDIRFKPDYMTYCELEGISP